MTEQQISCRFANHALPCPGWKPRPHSVGWFLQHHFCFWFWGFWILGREPSYWVLYRTPHEKSRASDSCALDSGCLSGCFTTSLLFLISHCYEEIWKKNNHILPINWGGVIGFLCNSSYCRWCHIVIQSRSSAVDGCVRGILWPGSSVPASVRTFLPPSLPPCLSFCPP